MPTYEYACKACGEHLEVVQSFKDDSLTVCPACGGALRKVFGSIGIAFRGSGFYRTDSRNSSSTGAKAEAAAAKSESKAAEAKSSGESSGADKAKSDGAKSDGAKSDGAKSDGAKAGSKAESKSA